MEDNDYSFRDFRAYTPNQYITVYRNGVLVYGQEPEEIEKQTQARVLMKSNNLQNSTNTLQGILKIENTGNVPLDYSKLKMRYWFTRDGVIPLSYWIDYATIGQSHVTGLIKEVSAGMDRADTYFEIGFGKDGFLYPLSNSGEIHYRIAKQDWSAFSQSNDHSVPAIGEWAENSRITIHYDNGMLYGTPPDESGSARLGYMGKAIESEPYLLLMGNPIIGNKIRFKVAGSSSAVGTAKLFNQQGVMVSSVRAVLTEPVSLHAGRAGIYVLMVELEGQVMLEKVICL